ncbi:MAG: hypothetical protein EZS28_002609 [Streblomastix strix]|uniref:Uncharacterized protein n=1 Tax=Streblomastix strix TaxID=222440 RepID=A0A5J4X4Z2_9EUKA|nr:MAG: hypothetical protein EZS28_002609 [Streblomastix strix]
MQAFLTLFVCTTNERHVAVLFEVTQHLTRIFFEGKDFSFEAFSLMRSQKNMSSLQFENEISSMTQLTEICTRFWLLQKLSSSVKSASRQCTQIVMFRNLNSPQNLKELLSLTESSPFRFQFRFAG